MKPLLIIFLCLLGFSCGREATTSEPTAESPVLESSTLDEPSPAILEEAKTSPYLISNGTFLGMKPGGALAEFSDGLRAGVLQTGDGDFDVFYIDGAEGKELGYLMADPRDENTIGSIYVTSPDVVTEKGVRVGISWAELQQRIGAMEVHGSEIEGYTYAYKDGLAYRLDANLYTYDVDLVAELKPEMEVLEIVVER